MFFQCTDCFLKCNLTLFRSLGTSFAVLLKSAQKKFPDAKTVVIVTLFSKFIGPAIENPSKYYLVGSETDPVAISQEAYKGLSNLSKLLASFATGEEIKDEPCASVARDSIQSMHTSILQIFDKLVVQIYHYIDVAFMSDFNDLKITRETT
jgi:hypothetical protein